MNGPENIVAAIYRTVDWTNGESKLALLGVVVEASTAQLTAFVERALLNRVYRKLWKPCDHIQFCEKKKRVVERKSIDNDFRNDHSLVL
jgi:hypothetical protein